MAALHWLEVFKCLNQSLYWNYQGTSFDLLTNTRTQPFVVKDSTCGQYGEFPDWLKTEFVSTNIFSYSLSFSVLAALPVLSSADADQRAGITKPSRARRRRLSLTFYPTIMAHPKGVTLIIIILTWYLWTFRLPGSNGSDTIILMVHPLEAMKEREHWQRN